MLTAKLFSGRDGALVRRLVEGGVLQLPDIGDNANAERLADHCGVGCNRCFRGDCRVGAHGGLCAHGGLGARRRLGARRSGDAGGASRVRGSPSTRCHEKGEHRGDHRHLARVLHESSSLVFHSSRRRRRRECTGRRMPAAGERSGIFECRSAGDHRYRSSDRSSNKRNRGLQTPIPFPSLRPTPGALPRYRFKRQPLHGSVDPLIESAQACSGVGWAGWRRSRMRNQPQKPTETNPNPANKAAAVRNGTAESVGP